MNKSVLILGIFTIVFVSAGIVVFPNVHDVSACPSKSANAALTTSPTPTISNINTLLSPSVLQSPSSQPS